MNETTEWIRKYRERLIDVEKKEPTRAEDVKRLRDSLGIAVRDVPMYRTSVWRDIRAYFETCIGRIE